MHRGSFLQQWELPSPIPSGRISLQGRPSVGRRVRLATQMSEKMVESPTLTVTFPSGGRTTRIAHAQHSVQLPGSQGRVAAPTNSKTSWHLQRIHWLSLGAWWDMPSCRLGVEILPTSFISI